MTRIRQGTRYRRACAVAGIGALVGLTVTPTPASAGAAQPELPERWGDAPTITVQELEPVGGPLAMPYDINDRGVVAGRTSTDDGCLHGALWDAGEVRDITPDVPCDAGRHAAATAVNDRGQVTGFRATPPSAAGPLDLDAFRWQDGELRGLSPGETYDYAVDIDRRGRVLIRHGPVVWDRGSRISAPELPGGARFAATAFNERGLVVGNAVPGHAYAWQPGSDPVDLGTLGGPTSRAEAVNDRGQVAGTSAKPSGASHAFRWEDREMTDLGTLGGAESRVAVGQHGPGTRAINQWGHVVGTSETSAGDEHAFLYRGGEMIDLGTLGGDVSHAAAVNAWGQVVGTSLTAEGDWHAFVWQNGRMADLGALTGAGDGSAVTDINDRGQIVGSVGRGGVLSSRAFLWTVPVLWGYLPAE